MSGTGGANSITSNRISFCLGLQGGARRWRAKSKGDSEDLDGWGQPMGRAYACNHVKVYMMNLYK